MKVIAFAVISGLYFWIGPICVILAAKRMMGDCFAWRKVATTAFATALVSWCVTAALAYGVWRFLPDALPPPVLRMAFVCGWAYLPVTCFPALLFYGFSTALLRHVRMRVMVGCACASIPYILLLFYFLPHLTAN